MASEIFACFGVNPENLGKEFSIVNSLNCDGNEIVKFDEGLIQRLYKLSPEGFLEKWEKLVANHHYVVRASGDRVCLDRTVHVVQAPVVDMQVYQSTLYVLHSDCLVIYKLPDFEEFVRFATGGRSVKVAVKNFGDLVYVNSPDEILRIESLNICKILKFSEEVFAVEAVFDSDALVSISCKTGLKIFNFVNSQVVLEQAFEYQICEILSVNENTLFLYSQERNLLASFACKEKQVLYTIIFNSKIPKQIVFCEETEQLLILNKNSCKLLVFSLDEEARVSKSVVFALKKPAEKFFNMVLENDLPDQAIYAGNSMHRLWVFTTTSIEVFNIEVVSTKTLGFRYGDEYEGLGVKEDPGFVGFQESPEVLLTPQPKFKSPEKVEMPRPTEQMSMEKLQNCLKTELSSEKVNTLVSLIAFKLEELLPGAIKNAVSQAFPSISKGINEAISDSFPAIENSLRTGIQELKTLQDEMTRMLKDLGPYENPKAATEKSLSKMLAEKSVEEIKGLLKNEKIRSMIQELSMDEMILLGHVLFEIINEEGAVGVFDEVCEKVSVQSDKFADFYMKVCSSSLPMLRSAQKILESKF